MPCLDLRGVQDRLQVAGGAAAVGVLALALRE
jgi:hypothetical protein